MTPRGPFQPLPFCDSVNKGYVRYIRAFNIKSWTVSKMVK